MQRLGFDEAEMNSVRRFLSLHPNFQVTGLCTHLSHGEEAGDADGVTQNQIRRFERLCEGYSGLKHVHKSSSLAALGDQVARTDLGSRPGIALYGLAHEGRSIAPGVRPVLSWESEIARVHTLEKGEPVGYGARFRPSKRSVIGVVPVGYGDGYSRLLGGRACMLFRGQRVPVVGTVCMDYTFLDLTEAMKDGPPHAGEKVTLIGRQGEASVSAQDLAEWAGTISYEIVTAISRRVPREATG
jgi:alanine racemase